MTVCFSEGTQRPLDWCRVQRDGADRSTIYQALAGLNGRHTGDGMSDGDGPSAWADPATEPSLHEILDDEIVEAVLARDGLDRHAVERFLVAQSLRLAGGFAPSARACAPECFAA